MFEPCISQAAGLQGLALQQRAPRMVAVASHGQQQGELPLLWGLCSCWIEMGLSVLVLDGHAQESPENQGLRDLLNNPLQHLEEDAHEGLWSILAATDGLKQLSVSTMVPGPLGHLFKNFSVVLIYADAGAVSGLLRGSALAPLVVVPPARLAALSAYQALKQLLIQGQLRPTVANIVAESTPMNTASTSQPARSVMDCASAFLGYSVTPLTIVASATSQQSRDDIHRLALQLLENSLELDNRSNERVH